MLYKDTEHKQIETLAYRFWLERGCPMGSPDDDWFRAERALNSDTNEEKSHDAPETGSQTGLSAPPRNDV
jgi:hypothetical protein